MASSSIYGSQVQSAAQSLAAYLQALQAKNSGNTADAGTAGNDIATAGTVVNGTGQNSKSSASKDSSSTGSQATDTVTLSAEAQIILANAQAPSSGPGSLATYLNTSNSQNGFNSVNGIGTDPFNNGFQGAIAQFKQWLSQPLGQPIPSVPSQSTDSTTPTGSDSSTTSGVNATSSTSA
jgi:hypothetical protein